MLRHFTIAAISLAFILGSGCKKDPPTFACDSDLISFSEDISPIFEQSCYVGGGDIGCHSAWVFSWEGIDNNNYWREVRQTVVDECSMPPETNDWGIAPLTKDEIKLVYCWFEQGGLDN